MRFFQKQRRLLAFAVIAAEVWCSAVAYAEPPGSADGASRGSAAETATDDRESEPAEGPVAAAETKSDESDKSDDAAKPRSSSAPSADLRDGKSATQAESSEVDDLMEELLATEEQESDLNWLYSDRIYESSDLGGETIPAPELPSRGAGKRRYWDPRWRRFGPVNYVVTGVSLSASVVGALLSPRSNRWTARNRTDEWVRARISINGYDDGVWARDTSDVFLGLNLVFPFLVDSLIIMSWYRDSPDVAGEMALIALEAVSVSGAIQGLTAGLGSRERPHVRNCGILFDAEQKDCLGRNPFRSFFSGHTAQSFAAASVACSHHLRHEVFGDPFLDGVACAGVLVAATTVGTMRVVGDRHFASDVLTGAAVGTLSGFGVPWLFHYGPLARQTKADTGLTLTPHGAGLGLRGKF